MYAYDFVYSLRLNKRTVSLTSLMMMPADDLMVKQESSVILRLELKVEVLRIEVVDSDISVLATAAVTVHRKQTKNPLNILTKLIV